MQMYKENDIALVDHGSSDAQGRRTEPHPTHHVAYDPEAAIIAVSGLAQHLDAAEQSGAITGLVKPVRPEDLIETIQEVLGGLANATSTAKADPTGEDLFGN